MPVFFAAGSEEPAHAKSVVLHHLFIPLIEIPDQFDFRCLIPNKFSKMSCRFFFVLGFLNRKFCTQN